MKIFAIGLLGIELLFCAAANAEELRLPRGWRLPMESEMDMAWRKNEPTSYLSVRADFNGDGIADQARLLMSEEGSSLGLFAYVSQKDSADYKVLLLDSVRARDLAGVMGISKVIPGTYKTACGKGYWDCESSELPVTCPL